MNFLFPSHEYQQPIMNFSHHEIVFAVMEFSFLYQESALVHVKQFCACVHNAFVFVLFYADCQSRVVARTGQQTEIYYEIQCTAK